MTQDLASTQTVPSTLTWEEAEQARELTENIVEAVLELGRENSGVLMGTDAWLRYAIQASDIILSEVSSQFVYCYGTTYTVQTMSNQQFSFKVPTQDVFTYIASNS